MITGETGAGKTMVVTALGLLLGGRADSGAVRTGAKGARVEGGCASDGLPGRAARKRVDGLGGEVEDGELLLARRVGRGPLPRVRRGPGGPGRRARRRSPTCWWPCTASPTSTGCCRPAAQRDALDRFAGARRRGCAPATPTTSVAGDEAELAEVCTPPWSAPRKPTCCASGSARSRRSRPGRARTTPWTWRSRLGLADTLRTAADQARDALLGDEAAPTPSHRFAARKCSSRSASTTRGGRAGRPARRGQLPALRRGRRRGVVRLGGRHRPGPARRVSDRRAALTALTRKYGETIDDVLAWSRRPRAAAGPGQHRGTHRGAASGGPPAARGLAAHGSALSAARARRPPTSEGRSARSSPRWRCRMPS